MKKYTHEEWLAEGKRLFGDDVRKWRFVCPNCKTEQGIPDLMDAGVAKQDVEKYLAFSCVGRFAEDKGCDWTLGGFFKIHKAEVAVEGSDLVRPVFVFAEPVAVEGA